MQQHQEKKDIEKECGHKTEKECSTDCNIVLLPLRRMDAKKIEGKEEAERTFEIYIRKEGGLIRTTENSEILKQFRDTFEPRELKLGNRIIYVTVLEHGAVLPSTFP